MNKKCKLCKIANKSLRANIVYKDEVCIGFTPLETTSKGHTVLIPKRHFENLFDIDEKILHKLSSATKKLALQLCKENKATGINLLHASGKDAQQSSRHFHFHLIPRYPNDGLDLWIRQKLQ